MLLQHGGHPSAAKAGIFQAFSGTAEAVPFHKTIYETSSMHFADASRSIDPSARKKRGPQDDNAMTDAEVFRAFVAAGRRLADLHLNHERQPESPLIKTEKPGEKLDWRVTKMRLSKDKTTLIYNDLITLSGIPPETYEYRLGSRSALEWGIDQYQVSTDKRFGITNDPNRADDPQYILRLIGVITVSLESVKIVQALPQLNAGETTSKASSGGVA
jgi:hypothetical protein